jgi:NAD(P)-dependent dehydrogenase (short-subunit alcohol dehydrogenase family)
MTHLSDKTALVTGASRGIGRASALALAKAGAQVLVHYGRAASEADAVVNQIRSDGGRAHAIAADLETAEGPHKLASEVRRIVENRLDVLIANAAIAKFALVEETTIEDFDSQFAVNVRAPYFLVQQLLPSLGAGSNVVFVSSAATHVALSQMSAYAATKGALETLVRHFGFILGERGIRVNAVAPGFVNTDASLVKTEAGGQFALSIQALKRIAQPDDIADVVTFLASNAARWITGQTLYADGGTRL